MSLSDELKKIRVNKYLTQEDFAKEIHTSFATVNRWENGKTKPNMKAMKNIVDFCKRNNIDSSGVERYWKL